MDVNNREKAIEWWNKLDTLSQMYYVFKYDDFANRSFKSLTGREIEIIYSREHGN